MSNNLSQASRDELVLREKIVEQVETKVDVLAVIDCAANTMRDMGCANRNLARVQGAALRQAHMGVEKMVVALRVLLRDYEAVHGDGDLEMQPALLQASNALVSFGGGK